MRLRVAIAADHGGFDLKQTLVGRLRDSVDLVDMGAREFDANDDYPDYVASVAAAVADGEVDRGIVICGSGVGACVAANKVRGVRASVCHDTYSAHQGVEHDDLNVLCLGARVVGVEVATELTIAFLMARFTGEERHRRRLAKVLAMEQQTGSAEPEETEDVEDAECPASDALGIPAECETDEADDEEDDDE
jgi:ribose 5-phosphate isomerase B